MNSSKTSVRLFRTLATLSLACVPWLAAAQTITLTVPYRGAASKQTASTTVEFDASAVAVGASATVGGRVLNVPASGCAGLACSVLDTTLAGDEVVLRRISGTQRVQVGLTYLSSFGGNFCAYTGPATPKNVDFTLSGFTFANATNGYRITSFMAPSDVSCDIPYVRVPSQRPSFPIPGPVTKLGRLPLNVVLVLDRSGSMTGTVPGSADIRWDRLKSSVEQFVKVWQVAGAPPAGLGTISSDGNAEDRLGLVFFNSAPTDGVLDGSFFKARGNTDSPWWTPVETALGISATGGTSIGGGIERGRTRLGSVATTTGDTAIVLFTDGEQNSVPCVMKEGETVAFSCQPSSPAPAGSPLILSNAPALRLAQSAPRGPIFTIGLGEGSGSFADLLEQISQETAGRSRITPTGAAMDTAFVDALVDSLKGSTMSLLSRTRGTLAAGASASDPMEVFVDDAVPRVVFVARWESRGAPNLEIRRPDGTVVTNNLRQTGNGIVVASVDLPTHGPAGAWQVRLLRPAGTPSAGAAPFQMSALAVESRLSYRLTESPRTGTGTPVTVTAELGWDGQGLAALPPEAIKVTVERPGDNLGNLLFDSSVRGDPRSPAGDTQDALRAKLDVLNAGGQLAQRIEPKQIPGVLVLNEVGLGRYEATFDPAVVGGQYRFRVDMDWTDARTGRIKRVETTERQVPVLPSAADTLVAVQRDTATGVVTLTLTPKDRFGNYVGPGYGNFFTVQVAGGTPVLPAADPSVRGIYVIKLNGIAPGADPQVKIEYRGVTLRDAPLSRVEAGAGPGGKYAIWGGAGIAIPHGSFSNTHDRGPALTLGVEREITSSLSVEATLGTHRFRGKSASPDVDVTVLGANAKWYFSPQPTRFFATAGLGAYSFDPGATRLGVSAGVGAQFQLAPQWSLEGRYGLHAVSNNSPLSTHATLLLALRYAF
jgi:hypothetical protein